MENNQNKILLDCRFWGPSYTGLGRYTQELVTAMIRQKPNYKLIVLKPDQAKIDPYSWAEQTRLPAVINSFQPDLTHFLHFNVPVNFNRPFIVTIHDLIKHHSRGLQTTTHWQGAYWLKRLGYHLVIRHAVLKSTKIIVPSHWVKQDILAHYPVAKNKIIVTPEAAGRVYFKAKKSAGLAYDYFIFVGNAYPHKNVAQLIKAVKVLNGEKQKVKLVIVTGRDWFYQKLREQITKLHAQNEVRLKDFTSDADLAKLYRGAIGFVTASFFEGFGLPGLEAMAAGTPVLSSNRAALPETYGKYAAYFDPDNLDELVSKMRRVLRLTSAERRKRIAQAYRYAQTFSWQKTANKTLEVYENCLGV